MHSVNFGTVYEMINDLTAGKQRNECNIKKIVCAGEDVTKDSEISDAFNIYFSSIGAELASNIRTTNFDAISYIPPTDKVFTFSKINVDTVNNLLKTTNANKATGPDNIPGRLLKIASDILSPSLTEIFNKSLSTGSYPDDWKMAKVMPIYKHGKITKLSSYRPISIISIVGKMFGRIVHDQFYSYLINNELLSEYQSGFRLTYSTVTALLETTNNWCVSIDRGLLNGVILLI